MMKKLGCLFIWDFVGAAAFFFAGRADLNLIAGLVTGVLTMFINYGLLKVVINNIASVRNNAFGVILAMLLYAVRLLIFVATIYLCVRISTLCAVGYAVSVIGFALTLVITNLRGDEND